MGLCSSEWILDPCSLCVPTSITTTEPFKSMLYTFRRLFGSWTSEPQPSGHPHLSLPHAGFTSTSLSGFHILSSKILSFIPFLHQTPYILTTPVFCMGIYRLWTFLHQDAEFLLGNQKPFCATELPLLVSSCRSTTQNFTDLSSTSLSLDLHTAI